MNLNIKINLDNDSFVQNGGKEIARALKESVIFCLDSREHSGFSGCEGPIWDSNGNKVGNWKIR